MQVIMTMKEFNELKQPDTMMSKTLDNYKTKLEEAEATITKLEEELKMYIIGGKKPNNLPTSTELKRKLPKYTNKSWSATDKQRIISAPQKNHISSVKDLAEFMKRTEASVAAMARTLGLRISKGHIVKR